MLPVFLRLNNPQRENGRFLFKLVGVAGINCQVTFVDSPPRP